MRLDLFLIRMAQRILDRIFFRNRSLITESLSNRLIGLKIRNLFAFKRNSWGTQIGKRSSKSKKPSSRSRTSWMVNDSLYFSYMCGKSEVAI